jgi:hypothetical protein
MTEQQQTLTQQLWERRQCLYWMTNEVGAGPSHSGWKQQIERERPEAVNPAEGVDKAVDKAIDAVEATILTTPPETVQDALLQLSLVSLKLECDDEGLVDLVQLGHDAAITFLARELQCRCDTMHLDPAVERMREGYRLARAYGYQEPELSAQAAE